ncbi:hypothetical protein M378DRAFT_6545 [Amanita muscaria Koide BX008]|uniref:SprT-like domain-containing protein n=1 Tax=Amanita muscaria (strain Koide BX008) TaxID=946122 RepID=A0A0C2X8A7_AMAMK|nr:hypothetical protein M378DRAFT_6545 [Amanita muscaria Koide BX008]
MVPLFLDEEEHVPEDGAGVVVFDDNDDDDGAILILDEPKRARKPLRVGTNVSSPATPVRHLSVISKSIETPKAKTSRAQAALEKEKRAKYAQQLFDELNEAVFKSALPKETKLSWNKRLLTTAGRAVWRKSKDGSHSTEIELSEKILDCNERIRNTLSHEMCHLAAWVIDGNPREGHGKLFKRWALKVMKKRPDIEISTRHNYEISYPYQWKCERCAKIYGRFSNSIRAEECVCGACKEGRLVPLFSTRRRAQKRDEGGSEPAKTATPLASDGGVNVELDSESEVEVLLRTFKSIAI